MKLKRHPANPILKNNPKNHWEAGSVLNPSVFLDNGVFRMLYRATNDIRTHENGGYVSSIGYAESTDGIHFKRSPKPLIIPDQPYESLFGCEDPRVTKINSEYFLYYTAVSGTLDKWKVRIALATSKDFKKWEKHGVVGPNISSKAAALFPEKVGGQYVVFYTEKPDSPLSSILEARFDNIADVKNPARNFIENNVVFASSPDAYRGAEVGAVPIKTDAGWLFIYCNANASDHPEWTANAALLDLDDPKHILAETKEPILKPETADELMGVVDNVTFPEGAVVVGEELYVYYGSGDQGISLATCNLNELLDHLKSESE